MPLLHVQADATAFLHFFLKVSCEALLSKLFVAACAERGWGGGLG